MNLFEKEFGINWQPEHSAAPAPCIQKYFRSNLYRKLQCGRPGIQDFVKDENPWKQTANIINTAYSQIIREKDPGLKSKMEKDHERALSLDSHSGLQR